MPVKILERPVIYKPSQFETLNIFKMEKDLVEPANGFKFATNPKAQKFYDAYVKDWEQQWQKGTPVVMTQD